MEELLPEKMIERFDPLILSKARKYATTYGGYLEWQDFQSVGRMAVVNACKEFREDLGVPFDAYVIMRINWAMRDEVRRYFNRDYLVLFEHMDLRESDSDPAEDALNNILLKHLEEGMECLDGVENQIIDYHFKDALSFRQIGKLLGVSKSQAHKLKEKALQKLHSHMGVGDGPKRH